MLDPASSHDRVVWPPTNVHASPGGHPHCGETSSHGDAEHVPLELAAEDVVVLDDVAKPLEVALLVVLEAPPPCPEEALEVPAPAPDEDVVELPGPAPSVDVPAPAPWVSPVTVVPCAHAAKSTAPRDTSKVERMTSSPTATTPRRPSARTSPA